MRKTEQAPTKRNRDLLAVALVVNRLAMTVASATAFVLLWHNTGSRNIALAAGTLVGAVVLFEIQRSFELRALTLPSDHISLEFTIDRAQPEIRQWEYSPSVGWRISVETDASSWLGANNRAAFEKDREKLTTDFALFSLLSFLGTNEFDWQIKRRTYVGKSTGTLSTFVGASKAHDCNRVTPEALREQLLQSRNLFANAPLLILTGKLCLPPRSTLSLSATQLLIWNPICELRFTVTSAGSTSYVKPKSGGKVPQLPNREAQFETRQLGLAVDTTFFPLRAQHSDHMKYREWTTRVANGARDWFEK